MIRALIKTAAVAALSSVAYRAWKSGKLDHLIAHFAPGTNDRSAPALDSAYSGDNASKPAEPHPWPVDKKSLGKNAPAPDAA